MWKKANFLDMLHTIHKNLMHSSTKGNISFCNGSKQIKKVENG